MCNNGKKTLVGKIAWALIIAGGLNWGLVGLGMFMGINLNAINLIFSGMPAIEWTVYLLVGVAVILKLAHKKCGACMPQGEMKM